MVTFLIYWDARKSRDSMTVLLFIKIMAFVFLLAGNISMYLLYRALKCAGFWPTEKVSGFGTFIWAFTESTNAFNKQRHLVDPKIRKKINFYLISFHTSIGLMAIMLVFSIFWVWNGSKPEWKKCPKSKNESLPKKIMDEVSQIFLTNYLAESVPH